MDENVKSKKLVWNNFFDINNTGNAKLKYSLKEIALMSKEDFRNVINEFFFSVYYQYYMENGIVNFNIYNPEILNWMGLPPNSGMDEIKKRFRELAKRYHPDTGGDSKKFIELMDNYDRLIEKSTY